jgi:dihydrofolate reductase
MINGFSIEGHAIVSRNGMIAASDGTMPPCLIREKDWLIFQNHLDEAEIVVLGSLGHEKHENKGRKRLILTSKVKSLETQGLNNFWNPKGLAFELLLERLKLKEGIIAVTGGKRVFDLFLKIGYDGFLLSEVSETITGGIACFSSGHPRDVLSTHGLKILAQTKLEEGLISSLWSI